MISIKLEIADDGIIKTIVDDNYNGYGSLHESKKVYSTDMDTDFSESIRFFQDLSIDLGINLGNIYENILEFKVEWGSEYQPSMEEIKERIKIKNKELKYLRNLKNSM